MPGYNTKAIRSMLSRKVKALLDSVYDDELRSDMARDIIVTGGSIMLARTLCVCLPIRMAIFKLACGSAHFYLKNPSRR